MHFDKSQELKNTCNVFKDTVTAPADSTVHRSVQPIPAQPVTPSRKESGERGRTHMAHTGHARLRFCRFKDPPAPRGAALPPEARASDGKGSDGKSFCPSIFTAPSCTEKSEYSSAGSTKDESSAITIMSNSAALKSSNSIANNRWADHDPLLAMSLKSPDSDIEDTLFEPLTASQSGTDAPETGDASSFATG